MKNVTLILISLMFLTGCATSNLNYKKPQIHSIKNQEVISESFDIVWDRLVRNLSSDFFVINNIEKVSRIINVSFSTNKPSYYVDCGESIREFSNARGKETYIYNPADSAKYTLTNDQGVVAHATRSSRLNGRTNTYVAPQGKDTLINVNTKYIVNVNLKLWDLFNQYIGDQNSTFDFSTKTNFSGPDGLICTARGNLEQKILDYAR